MRNRRPQIVVIEDDPIYRRIVHQALDGDAQVIDAATGEQGMKCVQVAQPDCILLDYHLPDADGLDLLRWFVERKIPVVMITGEGNEEVAVEAMSSGACHYLVKKNLSAESLQQAVLDALEHPSSSSKRNIVVGKKILLIDDDEVDRLRVQRLIAKLHTVIEVDTGKKGLETFLEERPDCVLLDYMLPDVSGLNLLDELVRQDATVVMLTGQGNEQVAVDAMKHGVQDYLAKDNIDADSLRRAINNALEKTEMRQMIRDQQQQLKRHAEDLRRSNRELQQFAYAASHDLQEPLRSVSSFCNLLQERYQGQFDEQADRWMGKIVRGAERMKTMIQDLLAYSRVESRGEGFRPTDLQRVLDNVVGDLAVAIRNSSAKVTSDELPIVMADESQMAQLLLNLISNAIKYRGDDPPAVYVSATRDGATWKLFVSDNGIGIEHDHFQRIFQMFKRLHTRDKYPGTGIGLALCQRIVHRHGGRIWVESQPDKGSTFYFTIPATIITEEADDSRALAVGTC